MSVLQIWMLFNKPLIQLTSIPMTASVQTWQVLSTISSYSAVISMYIHVAHSSIKQGPGFSRHAIEKELNLECSGLSYFTQ